MEHRPPECRVDEDPCGVKIVTLAGEHDMTSAESLGTTIRDAGKDGRALVVDLTEVDFIDSTTIHTLLRAHDDCGRRLVLEVQTSAHVRRLLEITGLMAILRTARTRDEAVQLALTPHGFGASE